MAMSDAPVRPIEALWNPRSLSRSLDGRRCTPEIANRFAHGGGSSCLMRAAQQQARVGGSN
jgi:hypothetical protein